MMDENDRRAAGLPDMQFPRPRLPHSNTSCHWSLTWSTDRVRRTFLGNPSGNPGKEFLATVPSE